MKWQQVLTDLKHSYLEATAPGFYAASGGRGMKIKPYKDTNTNSLTNAICDFLKFKGHYTNRINSTGTMRKIKGELKYTYGTTNRGSSDLTVIINGKHIALEIKCAATKDRVRPNQLKEKARIEAAGGIYKVVTNMDTFLAWYTETFEGANSSTRFINHSQ